MDRQSHPPKRQVSYSTNQILRFTHVCQTRGSRTLNSARAPDMSNLWVEPAPSVAHRPAEEGGRESLTSSNRQALVWGFFGRLHKTLYCLQSTETIHSFLRLVSRHPLLSSVSQACE